MRIILKIIRIIVTVFLLLLLGMIIVQRVSNNKVTVGDYYIFQIITGSMKPEYVPGDIIVVKKCDYKDIYIDDDVTYLGKESNVNGLIVTHRVIEKFEYEGVEKLKTKGINNNVEDPAINMDQVYGKVVYKTVFFSFLGKIMTNPVAYFIIFVVVAGLFSVEFISSFVVRKDEDEE